MDDQIIKNNDVSRTIIPKERIKVLIVDSDKEYAKAMADSLDNSLYECTVATSAEEFSRALKANSYNIILADIVSSGADDAEMIKTAKSTVPESEVVVITAYSSMDKAIDALNSGASDYLEKTADMRLLQAKIKKWVEKQNLLRSNIELQKQIDKRYGVENIIGKTEKMQQIFDVIQQISNTSATVLIYGESGTGKELIAKAIHNNSNRRVNNFVPLSCAALSESILESELFGHEKGAFTGALYTRKGRFEFADNGTLFLDEIGDTPISTQIKLLRAIEYGEIFRVGSNEAIKVDVRLIAATNKDLEQLIREEKFREDLYFRLKVVTIHIPPLRDRKEDIPLFIDTFIKEFSRLHKKNITYMTQQTRKILFEYHWPGNVRELKNCIESMVVVSKDDILDIDDMPDYITKTKGQSSQLLLTPGISLTQAEKELIKNTLAQVNGNRSKAAEILGIGERTLYRKIKEYELE